jgi:hypothetical protein
MYVWEHVIYLCFFHKFKSNVRILLTRIQILGSSGGHASGFLAGENDPYWLHGDIQIVTKYDTFSTKYITQQMTLR